MDKLISKKKKVAIKPLLKQEGNLITEYVETGEGDGISIIPLHEKIKKMEDGKDLFID